MPFSSISSEDLPQQAKYNSFILCQTKNIPLSEKFPFIVTTLKGKIRPSIQNQQNYEDFQYNYSFDCVSYFINGKSVILGEGNWARSLLTPKQNSLLESYEIINFDPLQFKNHIKFYFYHEKKRVFIPIVPKYLVLADCIVFEDVDHITETQFKIINLTETENLLKFLQTDRNSFMSQVFHFQCEYGIMSDIHFLGSFVRGFKSMGSYLKKRDSNEYFHFIDETLIRNLKRLYPISNL